MNEHNNAPLCECGHAKYIHNDSVCQTFQGTPDWAQCGCQRFTPTATDAREDADKLLPCPFCGEMPETCGKSGAEKTLDEYLLAKPNLRCTGRCPLRWVPGGISWEEWQTRVTPLSPAKPADPSLVDEAREYLDEASVYAEHGAGVGNETELMADFTARKVRDERIKIADELERSVELNGMLIDFISELRGK